MEIVAAYKTQIFPKNWQSEFIDNTNGSCRFVYNHMLKRNNSIYKRRKEHLSYYDMQNLLPVMKEYLPWLKEVDSQALKYACKQLNEAYNRFFKHESGFPKYKKKHGRQSYTTTNAKSINWESRRVKLPCLGFVKTRDNRTLPDGAKICRATISKDTDDKYYVSVSFKYEADILPTEVKSDTTIAFDYQVRGLYVDDMGNTLDFPKWYQDNLAKLNTMQRKLSHMNGSKKGETKSNRYIKQKEKISKLQHHISQQRYDFLHKQSTAITKLYDTICIEDLSIKDMMLKVEDTHDRKFRKNVNKAYLNNGWYMFTQMLLYKEERKGGRVVKMGKYFRSTQTCSCCGYMNTLLKDVNIKEWVCPNCNTHHMRDENSAVNIKAEGLRLLAS